MADEIQLSVQLMVTKGSLSLQRSAPAEPIDMTGTHYASGVQTIGFAAHETIVVPADVATLGVAMFVNVSAANFVEIGREVSGAFVPFAKLQPKQVCACPLSAGALYAKADTAAVDLEFTVLEA